MWSTPLLAATAAVLLCTAAAGDSSSSSPPSHSPSEADSCSGRADGFYATAGADGSGCSARFVACVAGASTLMDCPADLVYDEHRQQCEYPGNVVACGGVAPEEGSGIEEGSGGSGEEEGSGEGSGIEEGSGELEDISGMCVERADGFYRLGACSDRFLGCSGGVAWRMACPARLAYDDEAQQCDYPGNVAGCEEEGSGEGSGIEGSGEGSGIEEGSGEGSGVEGSGEGSGVDGSGSEVEGSGVESDVTIDEKQIETDEIIVSKGPGRGRKLIEKEEDVKETETEDDIIDDGSNEVAVEETKKEEEVKAEEDFTDDGSELSAEEQKEEEAEVKKIEAEDDLIDNGSSTEVEAVEEKPTEASEEVVDDVTESAPAPSTTAEAQHDDADETPSCEGRADGFYAMGCSEQMAACSNGLLSIMPCPAGLVFDEPNQMCDYPPHVAACASRDDAQLVEDALLTPDAVSPAPRPEIPRARDSAPLVDATLAPTTVAGPTFPPRPVEEYVMRGARKNRRDARCKSTDGFFALDCSREFVACRGGVATKLECAEEEAFEENGQSCVPLARHPLCFSHARQADNVIDSDVQMEREVDDLADLQKPIDNSFACDFVGAQAESECADWFTLCEAGRGIELFCQQGFLFDGKAAKCVPAGQLPHCQAH